jgi:hypothetical protein
MADLHLLPTAKTLKVGAHKRRQPQPQPTRRPKFGPEQWAALGCASVAVVLLGLSLAHLSHGISMITHAAMWESVALAIGVDAGLVAAEAAQLVAGAAASRAIKRWAAAVITGTVAWSGLLNAAAFGANAEGLMLYVSCAFGAAIPMMIFALCRIAVGLTHR